MKIYTGMTGGAKLEKVKKYKLGFMISSTPDRLPCAECKETFCALDNGAFISHGRGYPFMESYFLKALDKCYSMGINLDFIVVPDIIGDGERSLDFSLGWMDRLIGGKLALAVQDGMTPAMIPVNMPDVTTIFLGGSLTWKWDNAEVWKAFADSRGLKFHIGRCGNLNALVKAKSLGVTSVDSTNFVRNDNWTVLDQLGEVPSLCPSCGVKPDIGINGMVEHYDCANGFMIGAFTPKVWEHHCQSGNML